MIKNSTDLQRRYRGWEFCFLPGYQYRGQQLQAYCRWKRKRRYWLFALDYSELDAYPQGDKFNTALERVGPDLTGDLWTAYYDHFSRESSLTHGGWRWWNGRGLSLEFIHALRDLLIERYAQARTLYESWPVDPTQPFKVIVPKEDESAAAERKQQEESARQRQNTILAQKRARKHQRKYDEQSPCPVCGLRYVVDLISDRREHRKYHAEYLRPREPKPEPRLVGFPPGDIKVEPRSPKWLHRLIYDRARALRHDEEYDFAQWGTDHAPDSEKVHAWLFVEETQLIIGAASFEWVSWKDYPPSWHLNFVWVADTWRRKGMLSKRWSEWRATYDDFTVEYPVSESMESFLNKVGYIHLKDRALRPPKPNSE